MASDSDVREWLRGIGEKVSARGKVGERAHARYDAAHADDGGTEDFTEPGAIIDVEEPSSSRDAPTPDGGGTVPPAAPPPGPDEPPAHARREPRSRKRSGGGKTRGGQGPATRPPRVTLTVRGDIEAKIAFALEIPGRVWEARDPVCGGTFIQARPEIASALTEIVCGSPDLIAWFTGQGGQFMLYLNLAAACWPVVTVIMAHHVYHTVELAPPVEGEAGQPDYSRYAA